MNLAIRTPLIPAQTQRISADLGRAVQVLSCRPGVQRIWLFGSAARGRPLDFRSDLDFAVEGLLASELCGSWTELYQSLSFPVDLVRWEEASPALRDEILKWGQVLYAA